MCKRDGTLRIEPNGLIEILDTQGEIAIESLKLTAKDKGERVLWIESDRFVSVVGKGSFLCLL